MANNTGCRKSQNKTKLVDPNDFFGQSSTSNQSVSLEDLTILVELKATKNARTLLTTDSSKAGASQSRSQVTVNFFEGTQIGTQKVLTTAFTDLTTTFDDYNNGENLGITAIDIDFNSQYAPMITIHFVDVRGSAIFQNEDRIVDDYNKYSIFFQLPYPLYELTIKGYYGQPVKYCLHMTKFTSRFNAQTGNFEITASYIGYTYAMLSDMLLGYLKAIEYTNLGSSYYQQLKTQDPSLMTLNDLTTAISQINLSTTKILATDKNYAQLKLGDDKKDQLTAISNMINTLGQTIDIKGELSVYQFIISDPSKSAQANAAISAHNAKIADFITNTYNVGNNFTLDPNDFKVQTINQGGATVNGLAAQTVTGIDSDTQTVINNYVTSSGGYGFINTFTFNVYDNRLMFTKINEALSKIVSQQQQLKIALADVLRLNIKQGLGFDPTVRSIIKVFTTAVEVFLYALYEVSKKADASDNTARINELKTVFKSIDNSDITSKAISPSSKSAASKSTTPTTNNTLTPKYYAWPDYRKADQLYGFQEAYLGDISSGIKNPGNVTELVFIDDLYNAFIKQSVKEEASQSLLVNAMTNWFPVNPLDTRLFTQVAPYNRIKGLNQNELILLVILRASVFLGYTNDKLTADEIKNMANAEAAAILSQVTSPNITQSLTTLGEANYLQAIGNINGFNNRVLEFLDGNNYYYDYIFDTQTPDDLKVIPIDQSFQGNWDLTPAELAADRDSGTGMTFVTNYTITQPTDGNGNIIAKPDDGGKYIEIIPYSSYTDTTNYRYDLVSTPANTNKTMDLLKLQTNPASFTSTSNAGFNPMGGLYGTQEYSSLNFGDNSVTTQSFRFMFYQNGSLTNKTYNKSNGLGLIRGIDINGKSISGTTPFDLGPSFTPISVIGDYANLIDGESNYASQSQSTGRFSTNVHKAYGSNLLLLGKAENKDTNITYPFVNFNVQYQIGGSNTGTVNPNNNNLNNMAPVSLFGSQLYNAQTTDNAKALLFLHTFPWRGLTEVKGVNNAIFDVNEIVNTFSKRGGFISTPKIWAAFIGAMLWRNNSATDPIVFYAGTPTATGQSYIPTFDNNTSVGHYPTKSQYLTTIRLLNNVLSVPMLFANDSYGLAAPQNYIPLDDVLLALPVQAQNEFIRIFQDFVAKEWIGIKQNLEIFNGTPATWSTAYNNVVSSINNNTLSIADISPLFTNTASYTVFSPITNDSNFVNNFCLEIKDNSPAAGLLLDLFVNNQVMISNSTYRIWGANGNSNTDPRSALAVPISDMKLYVDTVMAAIQSSKQSQAAQNTTKQEQQKLFGTTDINVIKLMLYRTCKNIYDKWIGGTISTSTSSDDIIFKCGGRNDVDSALAANRGLQTPMLIDSFRFVSRSFRDIGNELAINPIPVLEILRNNPNTSFYNAVTSLLADNHFTFTSLPSFINYNDPNAIEDVFRPVPNAHVETINSDKSSNNKCGPSFVCVYVGQTSKHLDFRDSQYTNDGFDVRCDNGTLTGLPNDFNLPLVAYEDPVTFFTVGFGQANQNIFKDVILDQNEFGETAESLQIMDDISRRGIETDRTLAGQNIYSVYSVRSYKVEVEMMGNAMIQPMMYFQLNNIPMFHGAYMVTRVKHSLRPNHMSTHFTGVRIRKPETKIFDSGDLYMSLLDTIDNVNINNAVSSPFGTTYLPEPPIIVTIIQNGGTNGNIVSGNIKTQAIQVPKGIIKQIGDTDALIVEASNALNKMLSDWVDWMKSNGYHGLHGNYAGINSAFRTYQQQVDTRASLIAKYGQDAAIYAATPGNSRHGWGIAVDFQYYTKAGVPIDNYVNGQPNLSQGFDFTYNTSLVWLINNSYIYGWIMPIELRGNTPPEEFWHFEYHGKAATCLLKKNPNVKGITVDTSKPYDPIVNNPLTISNVQDIYNSCDYKVAQVSYDGSSEPLLAANPNIVITPPPSSDDVFYTKILTGVGAPATQENLHFFYAWRQAEGNKAVWNPFSTTWSLPNTNQSNYNCNVVNGKSYPVKNYATSDDGISATIKTLSSGLYPTLLQGLRSNVGPYILSTYLMDLDRWGTHNGINKVLAGSTLAPAPITSSLAANQPVSC